MAGYTAVSIKANETGLVQSREGFLLPSDAYPIIENAYVWRERIKRKNGYRLLGRLRRVLVNVGFPPSGASPWTINIYAIFGIPEPNPEIQAGTVIFTLGVQTFIDQGNGTLERQDTGDTLSTIDYITGIMTIVTNLPPGQATTISMNYYPGLPVMGIRSRELARTNTEETIFFDTLYAYRYVGTGFEEFIPGTFWTGTDYEFFWSTNYWTNASNERLFWVTNFSGTTGDPIRYTDGTTWNNFGPTDVPPTGQINVAGDYLTQCLALLPFRGRLVAFNTYEGPTLGTSVNYAQRIRWAQIGSPLTTDAWRDDIRGRGGYLDMPTSENIISVGFVRDNCVIYCERSTWQLRYTGRSIAPFQIERVNSELGTESTFSAVQFDTSLVGIGDKGIVECDSYQSKRIDIKIPDLVYQFSNEEFAYNRVHGIRDFQQRIAYWTYPLEPGSGFSTKFPNRRLVYNYENDSWAIFVDTFTALGTYQSSVTFTWDSFQEDVPGNQWSAQNYPWITKPALFPDIVGGNQQGFIEYLGSNFEPQVVNEESLFITAITGNTTTPTVITSIDHNLQQGTVIEIDGIVAGSFTNLNDGIFGIIPLTKDTFQLWLYNAQSQQFTTPQLDAPGTYIGGGLITIRDNFRIVSKKFNFIDDGQSIQIGYIDVLMSTTDEGAITLNMYLDYNDSQPSNTKPENQVQATGLPDTFFNQIVPTSQSVLNNVESSKYWHRVFCATRADFLTVEWTLSNLQMIGIEQESEVQIDAQIIWMRKSGRMNPL